MAVVEGPVCRSSVTPGCRKEEITSVRPCVSHQISVRLIARVYTPPPVPTSVLYPPHCIMDVNHVTHEDTCDIQNLYFKCSLVLCVDSWFRVCEMMPSSGEILFLYIFFFFNVQR